MKKLGKTQKITKIMVVLVCCVIVLTGCNNENFLGKLPDEPIVFHQETYVNPKDAEDGYGCLIYKGRTYVPYGTQKGNFSKKDVTCIGYIYDEQSPDDTNMRVYTIKKDVDENYLMDYYTYGGGFMQSPMFYRDIKTKGQEIDTPQFIDSLGYSIW